MPRRGTLISNPRLRESSDRSLGVLNAPSMCLEEVHALQDHESRLGLIPINFLLNFHQSSSSFRLIRTGVPNSRYWRPEYMVRAYQLIGTGHAAICLSDPLYKRLQSLI